MRSVATLAVAFVLLLLQSTVLEFAPLHMVTPSFGLIVVLYMGFAPQWTASSSALVAFSTGYLFDLVSGAPRGVHAFVYVLMVLFARALASRLAMRGAVLKAATACIAGLLAAFLVVVVRAQISHDAGYGGLRQAPFEAFLTGLFAPPLLWVLARVEGNLDPTKLRVGLARRRQRELGARLSK